MTLILLSGSYGLVSIGSILSIGQLPRSLGQCFWS